MRAVMILVVLAVAGCGEDKPQPTFVNADRIDPKIWGAPCGPQTHDTAPPPGRPGPGSRRWSNDKLFVPERGMSIVSCNLEYDSRTGRIYRLSVGIGMMERSQIEALMGNLIIQYLPPDVQLVAREVAFDPSGTFSTRKIGAFKIHGRWNDSPPRPDVDLTVEVGDIPQFEIQRR